MSKFIQKFEHIIDQSVFDKVLEIDINNNDRKHINAINILKGREESYLETSGNVEHYELLLSKEKIKPYIEDIKTNIQTLLSNNNENVRNFIELYRDILSNYELQKDSKKFNEKVYNFACLYDKVLTFFKEKNEEQSKLLRNLVNGIKQIDMYYIPEERKKTLFIDILKNTERIELTEKYFYIPEKIKRIDREIRSKLIKEISDKLNINLYYYSKSELKNLVKKLKETKERSEDYFKKLSSILGSNYDSLHKIIEESYSIDCDNKLLLDECEKLFDEYDARTTFVKYLIDSDKTGIRFEKKFNEFSDNFINDLDESDEVPEEKLEQIKSLIKMANNALKNEALPSVIRLIEQIPEIKKNESIEENSRNDIVLKIKNEIKEQCKLFIPDIILNYSLNNEIIVKLLYFQKIIVVLEKMNNSDASERDKLVFLLKKVKDGNISFPEAKMFSDNKEDDIKKSLQKYIITEYKIYITKLLNFRDFLRDKNDPLFLQLKQKDITFKQFINENKNIFQDFIINISDKIFANNIPYDKMLYLVFILSTLIIFFYGYLKYEQNKKDTFDYDKEKISDNIIDEFRKKFGINKKMKFRKKGRKSYGSYDYGFLDDQNENIFRTYKKNFDDRWTGNNVEEFAMAGQREKKEMINESRSEPYTGIDFYDLSKAMANTLERLYKNEESIQRLISSGVHFIRLSELPSDDPSSTILGVQTDRNEGKWILIDPRATYTKSMFYHALSHEVFHGYQEDFDEYNAIAEGQTEMLAMETMKELNGGELPRFSSYETSAAIAFLFNSFDNKILWDKWYRGEINNNDFFNPGFLKKYFFSETKWDEKNQHNIKFLALFFHNSYHFTDITGFIDLVKDFSFKGKTFVDFVKTSNMDDWLKTYFLDAYNKVIKGDITYGYEEIKPPTDPDGIPQNKKNDIKDDMGTPSKDSEFNLKNFVENLFSNDDKDDSSKDDSKETLFDKLEKKLNKIGDFIDKLSENTINFIMNNEFLFIIIIILLFLNGKSNAKKFSEKTKKSMTKFLSQADQIKYKANKLNPFFNIAYTLYLDKKNNNFKDFSGIIKLQKNILTNHLRNAILIEKNCNISNKEKEIIMKSPDKAHIQFDQIEDWKETRQDFKIYKERRVKNRFIRLILNVFRAFSIIEVGDYTSKLKKLSEIKSDSIDNTQIKYEESAFTPVKDIKLFTRYLETLFDSKDKIYCAKNEIFNHLNSQVGEKVDAEVLRNFIKNSPLFDKLKIEEIESIVCIFDNFDLDLTIGEHLERIQTVFPPVITLKNAKLSHHFKESLLRGEYSEIRNKMIKSNNYKINASEIIPIINKLIELNPNNPEYYIEGKLLNRESGGITKSVNPSRKLLDREFVINNTIYTLRKFLDREFESVNINYSFDKFKDDVCKQNPSYYTRTVFDYCVLFEENIPKNELTEMLIKCVKINNELIPLLKIYFSQELTEKVILKSINEKPDVNNKSLGHMDEKNLLLFEKEKTVLPEDIIESSLIQLNDIFKNYEINIDKSRFPNIEYSDCNIMKFGINDLELCEMDKEELAIKILFTPSKKLGDTEIKYQNNVIYDLFEKKSDNIIERLLFPGNPNSKMIKDILDIDEYQNLIHFNVLTDAFTAHLNVLHNKDGSSLRKFHIIKRLFDIISSASKKLNQTKKEAFKKHSFVDIENAKNLLQQRNLNQEETRVFNSNIEILNELINICGSKSSTKEQIKYKKLISKIKKLKKEVQFLVDVANISAGPISDSCILILKKIGYENLIPYAGV